LNPACERFNFTGFIITADIIMISSLQKFDDIYDFTGNDSQYLGMHLRIWNNKKIPENGRRPWTARPLITLGCLSLQALLEAPPPSDDLAQYSRPTSN
jgi:hypothetical protein